MGRHQPYSFIVLAQYLLHNNNIENLGGKTGTAMAVPCPTALYLAMETQLQVRHVKLLVRPDQINLLHGFAGPDFVLKNF
jgi:hypothetical protein